MSRRCTKNSGEMTRFNWCVKRTLRKTFRNNKIGLPLAFKICKALKEEKSETAGRLKHGIIAQKALFSAG